MLLRTRRMADNSAILVLMHAADDGPGTLPDFLSANRVTTRTIKLYAGDPLPENADGIAGVISLGGHMNVYQDREFPFLAEEARFLGRLMEEATPILGICLGAQMIARAAGAKVGRMDVMERGWKSVELTPSGSDDPLFDGLSPRVPVLQWHEDSFEIPPGGVLLASSEMCTNQAYRYRHAWGVQFHPEADLKTVTGWCASDGVGTEERESILNGFETYREPFRKVAHVVWSNFLKATGLR